MNEKNIKSFNCLRYLDKPLSIKKSFVKELLLGKSQEIQSIMDSSLDSKTTSLIEECQKRKIRIVTILDDFYPTELKQLSDPPLAIFIVGESTFDFNNSVSIVGSREASVDAIKVTEQFAYEAAKVGLTVISGLALGIDAASHRGALKSKILSSTFSVVAHDPSECFPMSNKNIYNDILSSGGLILSEYPPNTKPQKHHFVARNRIIAALSACTVVTQARHGSGALHTARFALDLGREVASIPWSISNKFAEGSNSLLKDGAHLLITPSDLISLYGISKSSSQSVSKLESYNLSTNQFLVIDYLRSKGAMHRDILKSTFYITDLELLNMEMDDIICVNTAQIVYLVE